MNSDCLILPLPTLNINVLWTAHYFVFIIPSCLMPDIFLILCFFVNYFDPFQDFTAKQYIDQKVELVVSFILQPAMYFNFELNFSLSDCAL